MGRSAWLAAVAAAGAATFALSFVEGWIVHDRVVRGEGFRNVQVFLSAWRTVAMPVLSVGALAALATAAAAAISLRRPGSLPGWLLPAGAVVTLALVGTSLVPVGQDGHTSSIDLTVGWLTGAGIALATLMVIGAARVVRVDRRRALSLVLAGLVTFGAGTGARWLVLQWSAGTNEQWSEGSYTRPATGSEETETLVISDGRYEIGDRWSGTWESSGLTVVLDRDPVCPGSRGAYHAHAAGESGDGLRFVKIVDTCRDGARAADLETGIWERDP